jgi:glycosyltransferase involved in cell wall biosynthesis
MAPAVSIILPTYDRLTYLREAVASVVAQTVNDWELIVVDDGSADETVPWLESLDDARISVVREAHTGHKARLRNLGVARARAGRIAFLDSDDRWSAEKLERQMAYHDANPRYRWSYTGRRFIDAAGETIPTTQFTPWVAHSGWILEQVITHQANIALPTVMVERTFLQDAGGFNENFRAAEDYELWVRLAERAECGLIEEPLLDIRKHRTETFQRPDVSLGFVQIYRDFVARTSDPTLRKEAIVRQAQNAVDAANRLGIQQRWRDAGAAIALAARVRPFSPFVYRAVARLLKRRLYALTDRATGRAA